MPLLDARLLQPNIAIAVVRGHFVASLCARPSVDIASMLESYVRTHASATQKFGYYLRLGDGASPPDEATREKLRSLGTKLAPRIVAVSTIIEIPGFVGAAIRGVVTGMNLVVGRTVKIRASSTIREGALAIDGTVREAGLEPLDAATLEDALAELRAMR